MTIRKAGILSALALLPILLGCDRDEKPPLPLRLKTAVTVLRQEIESLCSHHPANRTGMRIDCERMFAFSREIPDSRAFLLQYSRRESGKPDQKIYFGYIPATGEIDLRENVTLGSARFHERRHTRCQMVATDKGTIAVGATITRENVQFGKPDGNPVTESLSPDTADSSKRLHQECIALATRAREAVQAFPNEYF